MGSRLRRPLHNRRAGTQLACVIVVPAQAGTQRGKGVGSSPRLNCVMQRSPCAGTTVMLARTRARGPCH